MMSYLASLKTPRKLVLLFALLAVTISWTDGPDAYSDEYVTEALKSGAVVYATARGINATVSFLQGTELNPPLFTVAVGEFLDPINDLIERFSGMLMWALGSLVLQKILLTIFGHYGFSVLITTLFVLLGLSATYARLGHWFNPLLKLFIVTVTLHFMVAAAVMASSAIDQVFLKDADEDRLESMTSLQQELETLGNARPDAPTEEEVAAATIQLDALRNLETEQQRQIDSLRGQLETLESEVAGMRSEVSMVCRWNPMCDEGDSINAKKLEVQLAQAELSVAESANESTVAEIKEQREYLACAAKQQTGEACTIWGRAQSLVSPTEWKKRFSSVGQKMNDYSSNILALLVSWLTKTIVIPLFFLYAVIQLFKLVFRELFSGEFGTDTAEAD